jgi:hypothetical protein
MRRRFHARRRSPKYEVKLKPADPPVRKKVAEKELSVKNPKMEKVKECCLTDI